MKKEAAEPRLLEPGTYERTFREGPAVLLTAKARWPRLSEDCPGLRRIGRYYEELARRWQSRWEGPLLAQAQAAVGPETAPWTAEMDFQITFFQEGVLSLYIDISEDRDGPRPRRLRLGDAWALPGGEPVSLRQLLPRERWWRGRVMEQIRKQVGTRTAAGEAIFYEEWPRLASRHFSPQRFYLTAEGPTVFYPMETIAPALEGFPTFVLEGLSAPPEKNAEKSGQE